jgi:hypothetical protein
VPTTPYHAWQSWPGPGGPAGAPAYHGWRSWAGPEPAAAGPAPYWSAGYWSAGYWSPSYWGGDAAGAAPPAASLVGAVRDRLLAAIGADDLPGGVWNDEVPPRVAPPYVVLVEVSQAKDRPTSGPAYIADGILQVSTYALGRTPARTLAESAEAALNHAPLVFANGRLMLIEGAGTPQVIPDPERAPGRARLWHEARNYHYVYQGSD